MKGKFLFCFLYLSLTMIQAVSDEAHGQSIERQVVSASGDYYYNGNLSLEWTLGEVMTDFISVSNLSLSQGFHQVYIDISGLSSQAASNRFRIYPNPADNFINIDLNESSAGLNINLFNLLGNPIAEYTFNHENQIQIDLSQIPPGLYLMVIQSGDLSAKETYRIIKN